MLLLNNGAHVGSSAKNPVEEAVKAKNYKVMRALTRSGQKRLEGNITPLEIAIMEKDTRLVKEVLSWQETQASLS
jgi:hypothetical protein